MGRRRAARRAASGRGGTEPRRGGTAGVGRDEPASGGTSRRRAGRAGVGKDASAEAEPTAIAKP